MSTYIYFLILCGYVVFCEDIRTRCIRDMFKCYSTGACIPHSSVCDNVRDCQGGEDELNCATDFCAGKFKCSDSITCIDAAYVCDTVPDCSQGEDESDVTCANGRNCDLSTKFRCRFKNNQCIPKAALCNGKADCEDGSDEASEICVNVTSKCNVDEFKCATGNLCITSAMRCDNNADCPDNSDEKDCFKPTNPPSSNSSECSGPTHFRCHETHECIPRSGLCDQNSDCADGSDEDSCNSETTECPVSTDFNCGTGDSTPECIERAFVCDGKSDCKNGADEMQCNMTQRICQPYEFQCSVMKNCISNSLVCNGHEDCLDKSDERNCASTRLSAHCDTTTEFDCYGDGKKCILLSLVCNKHNDCGEEGVGMDETPGGSRRNCEVDQCAVNRGNCSHKCINHYFTRVCACPTGFRLANDNITCIDVDECEERPGICSQVCNNTKGSYKCNCLQGYTKSFSDTSRCQAIGEKFLYYSIGTSLREIRLLQNEVRPVIERQVLATAIDFEYPVIGEHVHVLFSDVVTGSIRRLRLAGKENTRRVEDIFQDAASVAEGIAYDCVHKLLFWTDAGHHKLYVMNITSRARHVLVGEGLDKPRGIVVDPEYRRVYWTDWGTQPRIESIGMDGQGRRILTHNVSYPNGLAMDYIARKLYWGDSRLHSLVSLDLKTLESQTILQYDGLYPFGVEVFEDRLYWSDWLAESVFSVDKYTGNKSRTHVHARKPMGLRMLHEMKQFRSQSRNSCADHACSHLCLPKVSAGDSNELYICACPMDGAWKLASDRHTCVQDRLSPGNMSPNSAGVENLKTSDATSREATTQPDGSEHINIGGVIGPMVVVMVLVIGASSFLAYRIYRNYIEAAMQSMHINNSMQGNLKSASTAAMPGAPQWDTNTLTHGREGSRTTSEDTKELCHSGDDKEDDDDGISFPYSDGANATHRTTAVKA